MAKFLNDKEIGNIISKLKGSTYSVSRDYSGNVRVKRRNLPQHLRSVQKDGAKMSLHFDKLFLNNQVFVWNSASDMAVNLNEGPQAENN